MRPGYSRVIQPKNVIILFVIKNSTKSVRCCASDEERMLFRLTRDHGGGGHESRDNLYESYRMKWTFNINLQYTNGKTNTKLIFRLNMYFVFCYPYTMKTLLFKFFFLPSLNNAHYLILFDFFKAEFSRKFKQLF